MTTLQGPRVRLRPVTSDDLPTLRTMLRQPAVSQFWSAPDESADRSLRALARPRRRGSVLELEHVAHGVAAQVALWLVICVVEHHDVRLAGG